MCTLLFNSFSEIYFTYHTIHLFNMHSSVVFSLFRVVQPSPQLILKYFLHLRKRPCTHLQSFPISHSPPQPLITTNLVSALWSTYSWYFLYMESYNMWPFVNVLFHLACFQCSSLLQHESELHPLLWLNNIPLYVYTTFCLSIDQLMDIWVVSTF